MKFSRNSILCQIYKKNLTLIFSFAPKNFQPKNLQSKNLQPKNLQSKNLITKLI